MVSPAVRKSGYLPGLDGLRAIAILGVMATHDLPWTFAGHSNERWKGYGGWGVYLFFAISGVLIPWRLLEEETQKGRLSMRAFYVRRFFRIQPAAFVFLAVVAVLFLTQTLPSSWPVWWSAVFSCTNFVVTPETPAALAAFLGHFWTLSVEEHFYLLISVVFLVPGRHRTLLLLAAFTCLTAGQTWAELHGSYAGPLSERRTYWVIQFLLFPVLVVLAVRQPEIKRVAVAYLRPWVAIFLVFAAMALHILWVSREAFTGLIRHFSPLAFVSGSQSFLFYGLAVWVIAIMLHPQSSTTRLLEVTPVRFLGRLSYSVYLWHILFFVPLYLPNQIHSRLLMTLSERPWKYVATLGAALCSYYLLEKPMIRIGHRIAPPASAGHQDLAVDSSAPARALAAAGTGL